MAEKSLQSSMKGAKSARARRPHCRRRLLRSLITRASFRADVPTVARLYEVFFDAVVPTHAELRLSGLDFQLAEAAKIAAVLPRYERLKVLDLSKQILG